MEKVLDIPIYEVMSRDLLIVQPADSLERVKEIFQARLIHHIPVIRQDGKLAGVLSKSDFLRVNHTLALFDQEKYGSYNDKLFKAIKVEEIMTRQVVTLSPEDTLATAAEIFRENLFHCLPVCEEGVLIGLVTTHDLLNYCFSELLLLEKGKNKED